MTDALTAVLPTITTICFARDRPSAKTFASRAQYPGRIHSEPTDFDVSSLLSMPDAIAEGQRTRHHR